MTSPHLCHLFPTYDPGGPQVRTAMLINSSNGAFRHTVVSMNGGFRCRTRIRRHETVGFVEAPPKNTRGFYPLALAQVLRVLRPDMVLTYNWGAIEGVLAARLCGIRQVIHMEDGFGPDEVNRQKLRRLLARRIILQWTARVVCPSRTLVRIAQHVWHLPLRRISYIPNGVDGMQFSPNLPEAADAVRQRLGRTALKTVVGTVGHLRREKNQERLIRAFLNIVSDREAKLLIVGDGPWREKLACRVQEPRLGGQVVFTGEVSNPLDCYRAMDIFALSSDTEQMPIVVLEAMSVGLPIVSTDVGDIRDMVSPANRPYVVPLENDAAYTQALAQLIDEVNTRALLGRANREKCLREFDAATMIKRHLSLYHDVLETGH